MLRGTVELPIAFVSLRHSANSWCRRVILLWLGNKNPKPVHSGALASGASLTGTEPGKTSGPNGMQTSETGLSSCSGQSDAGFQGYRIFDASVGYTPSTGPRQSSRRCKASRGLGRTHCHTPGCWLPTGGSRKVEVETTDKSSATVL